MIPVRYRPLLALLPALALLAGCGGSPSKTVLCGGPETPLAVPPAPIPGDPPAATSLTQIQVSGWRYPDTSVWIDGTEAVPIGCDRFWTATVDLAPDMTNTFTLMVKSRTLNPSPEAALDIVQDGTPPAAPVLDPVVTPTAEGTATVTGTREAGAEVRLDGRPVVAADPVGGATAFSVEVALAAGDNDLSFTAVDRAGNEGPATQVTVTRSGTDLPAPLPIKPLERQRLPTAAAITFLWSNVVNPGVHHYQVEVADSPGFDPGGFLTTAVTLDPVTVNLTVILNGAGRYYWRVGSVDTGGVVTYGRTLGFSLGPVPADVNGDGFSDVLAGLPGWDGGADPNIQDNRGRVNLYLGDTFPPLGDSAGETPSLQYDGDYVRGQLGISVTAGDLNGDGYADVAAGANLASVNARSAGQVRVYLGGASPDADADLVIDGQNFGDGLGQAVASGFDLNADGYEDLAVSAWLYDDGPTRPDAGRVYVFFGGPTPDGVPDLVLTGSYALENFGSALAGNLDFNGDGYTDLAVGGPIAPANSGALADAGRVVVYYGGPWVDNLPDLVLEGQAVEEHFGASVTGAGDMDGDGFDELAAGAPAYEASAAVPSVGRVQVFRGGLSPATTPAVTLEGAGGCEAFGTRVSGGGDLNRDGFADLAVGIPFSDLAGASASCDNTVGDFGAVEIHFGSDPLGNGSVARFTGEAANDWLGLGLHLAGDVNGDDVPDLVFGAPNSDDSITSVFGDVGRGYVLLGRAGPAPWAPSQSAGTIAVSVQGAVLPNDGGKDGLGGAVW